MKRNRIYGFLIALIIGITAETVGGVFSNVINKIFGENIINFFDNSEEISEKEIIVPISQDIEYIEDTNLALDFFKKLINNEISEEEKENLMRNYKDIFHENCKVNICKKNETIDETKIELFLNDISINENDIKKISIKKYQMKNEKYEEIFIERKFHKKIYK